MKKNNLKLSNFLLIIFLAAGIVIRLINIRAPLLEFFPERQTQTAEITRNIYVNGWTDFWTPKVRYITGSPIPYVLEFPLYNLIVVATYKVFGLHLYLGRAVSILFSMISAIVFYKLIRGTASAAISLSATLVFTLSPISVLIGRSYQPDAFLILLLLLAIYKRSFFIFSIALLVKVPVFVFSPLIFLSPTRLAKVSLADFIKFGLAIIPVVLWSYHGKQLTTNPALIMAFNITNWFQIKSLITPSWYFSVFQVLQVWVLTTLGLIFLLFGLAITTQNNKWKFWWYWLILAIGYVFLFNYHNSTHEYYQALLVPILAVFTGVGFHFVLNSCRGFKSWRKPAVKIGVVILFIAGLLFPALRRIHASPQNIEGQDKIMLDRYILIEQVK